MAHRLVNSVGFEKVLGRLLWNIEKRNKFIKIPKEVIIGYGFCIAHNGPVIINPSAVIGDNCGISQNCTIGANDGKAAVIGNNVYIGPNVCIVENIHIGDNVTIGAGSIVVHDVPDNATIAGNYAKILNFNNPGRYTKNKYLRKE